jgi:hypothetical protein
MTHELPDDMAYTDLPEEVRRVLSEDDLREILAAWDPSEPVTYFAGEHA